MSEEEIQDIQPDNLFYLGTLYILDDADELSENNLPKIFDFTRVYLNDNHLSKKGIRSKQLDYTIDDRSLLGNRSLASLEVLAPGSSLSTNDSNTDLSPIEDDIAEASDVPEKEDDGASGYDIKENAGSDFETAGDNVIINLADLKVADMSTLNRKINSQEICEEVSNIPENIASRSVAFVLKNFHLPEPAYSNTGSDGSIHDLISDKEAEVYSLDSSDLEDFCNPEDLCIDFKAKEEITEEEDDEAAAMRALGLPTSFGKDSSLYDPAAEGRSCNRKKAKRKKSKTKSLLQREISCIQYHSHMVDKIFNDLWNNWKGGWLVEDQINFYNILKGKFLEFLAKRAERQKEKELEGNESKDAGRCVLKMDSESDCNRFFGVMGFVSDFLSSGSQCPNSACYQIFPKTLSSTKHLGLLMLPLHQTGDNSNLEIKISSDQSQLAEDHDEPDQTLKRDLDPPPVDDHIFKRPHTSDVPNIADSHLFDPRLDEEVGKYWPQRYRFFDLFDEGIQLDKESWFSVTPQVIAEHHANKCRCDVIIDAFCGAGGNTIRFAQTCQLVIAIDIDPVKLSMAQHNAKIYGVEQRCIFILGDFFQIAKTWRVKADIVFLSPPWGGPDYLDQSAFYQPKLADILDAALTISSDVVYHAPRNINIAQLLATTHHGQRCQIEQNIVNYKLKVITVYWGNLLTQQQSDRLSELDTESDLNIASS